MQAAALLALEVKYSFHTALHLREGACTLVSNRLRQHVATAGGMAFLVHFVQANKLI